LKVETDIVTSIAESPIRRAALINVREYLRGNQKGTVQRNWQYRVHKTKKN